MILSVIVLFFALNVIKAQNLPDFLLNDNDVFHKQKYREICNHSKNPLLQKDFIPLEKRNYDVLRYDLFMDWYDLLSKEQGEQMNEFNGINKILLEIMSDNTDKIEFDVSLLKINKISIDGEGFDNYKNSFGKLTLNFDTPKTKGESLLVEIDYDYSSTVRSGLIFLEKGTPVDLGPPPEIDTILTEERMAYTMSEPMDARKWMPCNDYPYDKAVTSIAVKVPKGFTVVGNGVLDKTESDELSETFYWKHDFPITTYLMHVAASKFAYYYEWYNRVSNPNDSIKVEYYAWQKDMDDTTTTGKNYNARNAFRNTVKMLELYSSVFGEYPFERYGMTSIPATWFSGMEHQTITTLNRNITRNIDTYGRYRDYDNQSVIAHELAHQWLGDYITCASWNDIWINEGGAVWSEALWDQRLGENYYYSNIDYEIAVFLWYDGRNQQPPIYAPGSSTEQIFNYATTYAKSGIFYHMLSEVLGRERFLGNIRDLLSTYAFQSINTEEFKEFFKAQYPENPPINFDEFFEQWIYKAGFPKFQIEMSSEQITGSDNYSVDLSFNQIQEGFDVPEVFRTPLWIKFLGNEGEEFHDSVYTQNKEELHNFTIPFMPSYFEIDTLRILCQVNPPVMSVKESKANDLKTLVYPNPVVAGFDGKINYKIDKSGIVKVEIFDELGQLARMAYEGNLPQGNFEFELGTANLGSGNYFVKISNGDRISYSKFTIIR